MTIAQPPLPAALEPMRAAPRWVLWKKDYVKGRFTKVPYTSKSQKARTDDPRTWRARDKLAQGPGFSGIGVVLGDGLVGVDMDACLTETGALEPWAAEVLQRLPATYAEVSPSGRGIKLLCQVTGAAGKSASVQWGSQVEVAPGDRKRRELALFTGGRFFTVTGRVFQDAPIATVDVAVLDDLRAQIARIKQQRKPARPGDQRDGVDHHPCGGAGAANALPAALLALIQQGAPEGQRSEQFFHAVRWCADAGLAASAIVVLLEQYPDGIGAKYAGRVAAEVQRALDGYTPKPPRRTAAPRAVDRSDAQEVDFCDSQKSTSADAEPELADFADPVAAARAIVARLYHFHGLQTLHYWQGEFYWWTGSHYVVLPMADVRQMLYHVGPPVSKAPVKKRAVDDVLDALKALANLSHRQVPAPPAWTVHEPGDADPRAVIPCRNGLVRIDDHALLPPTPRLFVPNSLPFDYSDTATAPVTWFQFLASLWRDDRESIACLQEWLGLLLTAETGFQKGLMIVGPKRSGKGTIGRVIVRLVGERNVAASTLASLGNVFGLEPVIGKTVLMMSDARIGKADTATITENLLRIIGEDTISVDRKFREAYTARMLARVVVLTNEVPVFRDAATALPSRFIVLRTTASFYGREDHGLDAKLAAELPGILLWALEGLRRLRARGRFVQPRSAEQHVRLMEDMASPITAFLRDECIVEPGARVPVGELYKQWRAWCNKHGRDAHGTEQTFGRDIAAALPAARVIRPKVAGTGERFRAYAGLRLRTPDDPEHDDDAEDE